MRTIRRLWEKLLNQEIIISIVCGLALSAYIFSGVYSAYSQLSNKYTVSQNGHTYTGRMLRSRSGLSMITEDGRYIILYDAIGPIEVELKEDK